jgi:hypothetical protein
MATSPWMTAILKAAAKRPDDRWQSAGAFADALEASLLTPAGVAGERHPGRVSARAARSWKNVGNGNGWRTFRGGCARLVRTTGWDLTIPRRRASLTSRLGRTSTSERRPLRRPSVRPQSNRLTRIGLHGPGRRTPPWEVDRPSCQLSMPRRCQPIPQARQRRRRLQPPRLPRVHCRRGRSHRQRPSRHRPLLPPTSSLPRCAFESWNPVIPMRRAPHSSKGTPEAARIRIAVAFRMQ